MKFKVEQITDSFSTEPSGFSSGDASEFGSFKYQFHEAGIYYYWSGFVDINEKISFRGVIEVLDETVSNKEFPVDVFLNDIQGKI